MSETAKIEEVFNGDTFGIDIHRPDKKLWFMCENKPTEEKMRSINIHLNVECHGNVKISQRYDFYGLEDGRPVSKRRHEVFATKQELLESL